MVDLGVCVCVLAKNDVAYLAVNENAQPNDRFKIKLIQLMILK